MVTYFNKKDLVNFGKYLLSDKRKLSIEQTETTLSAEERLKQVHNSDVENFLAEYKKVD